MQRNLILAVMITGALLGSSKTWADSACEWVNDGAEKGIVTVPPIGQNTLGPPPDSTSSAEQNATATEPGPKNSNASDARKKVP